MRPSIILFLSACLTTLTSFGQGKILYHEYGPTASSWDIIEWNISDTVGKQWVLAEEVDHLGRVRELRFMEYGRIDQIALCCLATRVTFEYIENTIVETLYHGDIRMTAEECGRLDSEDYISKIEYYTEYDTTLIPSDVIAEIRELDPEYRILTPDSFQLEIDYFYHSFAKMNGVYPVSRNYKFDEDHYYYGDEPEKTSILEGLRRK